MVHTFHTSGRRHYGPNTSRVRPHDSGCPSSEQHSQESLRALSRRHGINPKTVAKWRKRYSVADLPTGPKTPHSTVLPVEQEAIIVAFRLHTLLPLDDCLYALQATIPQLTRSGECHPDNTALHLEFLLHLWGKLLDPCLGVADALGWFWEKPRNTLPEAWQIPNWQMANAR